MQPHSAPTCAKCGATLPAVTDAEFRCQYCGAVYRQAKPHAPPHDRAELAAMLAERLVAQQQQRPQASPFRIVAIGCFALIAIAIAGVVAIAVFVPDPSATAQLRMCGSNTIGADLAPSLVESFMKGRNASNVTRSSASKKTTVTGTLAGETSATTVSIEGLGSSTAFTGLSSGSCDVAMASRRINDGERASLPSAKESVIGLDGIAVVVHPSNPIASLDTEQLSRIFRGDATDWSQVGGSSGPITVFARDANSGTWDTFRGLVLATGTLVSSAQRFDSNEELVSTVARTPGAIGFASLGAAKGAKTISIGEPGAPPIAPTVFTVSTETYPLTRRLYLYTTKPHILGDALVTFALSPEGQALVSKSGFVDLTPHSDPNPPAAECKGCTPEYKSATSGGQRMSVDFRFESGGTNLDSRGALDIDRVATFAKSQRAKRVTLLGFADSQGSQQVNLNVSTERAKAVQKQLKALSVDADAIGLGDSMPVASNATPEGRERNRRVEVWIFK